MKTIFTKITTLVPLIALMLCGLSSCSDDNNGNVIVDWYPISIECVVTNSAGEDMIAPNKPLYKADFKMEHDGSIYEALWGNPLEARALLPQLYGLKCDPGFINKDGYRCLMFGTFDPFDFDGSMTFIMPNGQEHEILIYRQMTLISKTQAITNQTVTVDGKVIDEYTNGSPIICLHFIAD